MNINEEEEEQRSAGPSSGSPWGQPRTPRGQADDEEESATEEEREQQRQKAEIETLYLPYFEQRLQRALRPASHEDSTPSSSSSSSSATPAASIRIEIDWPSFLGRQVRRPLQGLHVLRLWGSYFVLERAVGVIEEICGGSSAAEASRQLTSSGPTRILIVNEDKRHLRSRDKFEWLHSSSSSSSFSSSSKGEEEGKEREERKEKEEEEEETSLTTLKLSGNFSLDGSFGSFSRRKLRAFLLSHLPVLAARASALRAERYVRIAQHRLLPWAASRLSSLSLPPPPPPSSSSSASASSSSSSLSMLSLAVDWESFEEGALDWNEHEEALFHFCFDRGRFSFRPLVEAFRLVFHENEEEKRKEERMEAVVQAVLLVNVPGSDASRKTCFIREETFTIGDDGNNGEEENENKEATMNSSKKKTMTRNTLHVHCVWAEAKRGGCFTAEEIAQVLRHASLLSFCPPQPQQKQKEREEAIGRKEGEEEHERREQRLQCLKEAACSVNTRNGHVDHLKWILRQPCFHQPDELLKDAINECLKGHVRKGEEFLQGWICNKINFRGQAQERVVVLTSQALYTFAWDFARKRINEKRVHRHDHRYYNYVHYGSSTSSVGSVDENKRVSLLRYVTRDLVDKKKSLEKNEVEDAILNQEQKNKDSSSDNFLSRIKFASTSSLPQPDISRRGSLISRQYSLGAVPSSSSSSLVLPSSALPNRQTQQQQQNQDISICEKEKDENKKYFAVAHAIIEEQLDPEKEEMDPARKMLLQQSVDIIGERKYSCSKLLKLLHSTILSSYSLSSTRDNKSRTTNTTIPSTAYDKIVVPNSPNNMFLARNKETGAEKKEAAEDVEGKHQPIDSPGVIDVMALLKDMLEHHDDHPYREPSEAEQEEKEERENVKSSGVLLDAAKNAVPLPNIPTRNLHHILSTTFRELERLDSVTSKDKNNNEDATLYQQQMFHHHSPALLQHLPFSLRLSTENMNSFDGSENTPQDHFNQTPNGLSKLRFHLLLFIKHACERIERWEDEQEEFQALMEEEEEEEEEDDFGDSFNDISSSAPILEKENSSITASAPSSAPSSLASSFSSISSSPPLSSQQQKKNAPSPSASPMSKRYHHRRNLSSSSSSITSSSSPLLSSSSFFRSLSPPTQLSISTLEGNSIATVYTHFQQPEPLSVKALLCAMRFFIASNAALASFSLPNALHSPSAFLNPSLTLLDLVDVLFQSLGDLPLPAVAFPPYPPLRTVDVLLSTIEPLVQLYLPLFDITNHPSLHSMFYPNASPLNNQTNNVRQRILPDASSSAPVFSSSTTITTTANSKPAGGGLLSLARKVLPLRQPTYWVINLKPCEDTPTSADLVEEISWALYGAAQAAAAPFWIVSPARWDMCLPSSLFGTVYNKAGGGRAGRRSFSMLLMPSLPASSITTTSSEKEETVEQKT